MTITVAYKSQTWFTQLMTQLALNLRNRRPRRETITEKADRMVAEGRYEAIRVGAAGAFWVGNCEGDHETYAVFSIAQWFMDEYGIAGGRVGCSCRYGRQGKLCSHATGAEQLRKESE